MGQFEIKQSTDGDVQNLQLVGQIDEDTDFSTVSLAGSKKIVMNLDQVKSINSCGIREWIKWLEDSKGAELVEYHKCPKIIVDQINMVDGFLPSNGKVMSFYVPYYSDDSGNEKDILFVRGKDFDENGVTAPEELTDEESGEVMEMDVIATKYFKFIK